MAGAAHPRAGEPSGRAGGERPKTLILDVYGAYARRLGGWLAVADLIALLGRLGVDEYAVRSAVSRMSRRSLLVSDRRNGTTGYCLSQGGLQLLIEGDRRIFTVMQPASLEDGWVLVSFSVPEQDRPHRHVLRSRLSWLGFGNLSSGVWIAPRRIQAELCDWIGRLGLQEYVDIFEAHYRGFDQLSEVVRRSWNLRLLQQMYGEFVETSQAILSRWEGRDPETDRQAAFVDYTLALHRWRKFPFLDPGLPLDLLPDDWAGSIACSTFFAIQARLEGPANHFVDEVTERTRGARVGALPLC